MMRPFASFAMAYLAFYSNSASAQDCTDLARVIGREITKLGDQDLTDSVNTDNLCVSNFENASSEDKTKISAAYGAITGNVDVSSQNIHILQDQRCENHFGAYWHSKVVSKDYDHVSQLGADVIKACLQTNIFRLTDLTIQNQALNATFRYNGRNDTTINGINVSPNEIADCNVLYDSKRSDDIKDIKGYHLQSGSAITLACQRKPDLENKDIKSTQKHFQGGIISISTSDGTAVVPLISYDVPIISDQAKRDLQDQIDVLKSQVQKFQSNLQTQSARKIITAPQSSYDRADKVFGSSNATIAGKCPDGEVVIGLDLIVGGSCNNQCAVDGRPVNTYFLKCAKPTLQ